LAAQAQENTKVLAGQVEAKFEEVKSYAEKVLDSVRARMDSSDKDSKKSIAKECY